MVPLHALWLPIIVSSVIVFFTSWLIHMLLPLHRSDFKPLPNEDAAMDAIRALNLPPGDYMMPRPVGPQAMRSAEFHAKLTKGPVAVMTVMKSGRPNMGSNLLQWFVYLLVVGSLAGYIAGRALPRGAEYLHVFRFVGCTAFACYAVAMWQDSIWYKRAWATTMRYTLDGLVFGLLTAGTFGWLWPK